MSGPDFKDVFANLLEQYRRQEPPSAFTGTSDTRFYSDSDWFEREKAALFSSTPILLGHVSMLPNPGDVFTHDLLGKPIMVVKAEDGAVRAFLNVCRHRGVRLVNAPDTINKKTFVCPYHNWTYKLNGDLKHVPLEEESFKDLNKRCLGLKELPLAICEGLIFVCPDPDGEVDLDKHIGSVDADFAAFRISEHHFFRQTETVVKSNWKLLIEAFQDGYHITRLHRKTVGPSFIDGVSRSERNCDNLLSVIARKEFDQALELQREDWDLRKHASCAMYIFPNVVLIIHPDYVSYLALFPTAVDETIVVHGCFIEELPTNDKARAHWDRAFDIVENGVFGPEDFFVCEQTQIGIKSGANTELLFGTHEKGVDQFHEILREKMGSFEPS